MISILSLIHNVSVYTDYYKWASVTCIKMNLSPVGMLLYYMYIHIL